MSNNNVNTAEVLGLLTRGCTPRDVALQFGVSEWHIRTLARENGYRFNVGPKSRVDQNRLRELVDQRLPLRVIAAEFGVSVSVAATHKQRLLKSRELEAAASNGEAAE